MRLSPGSDEWSSATHWCSFHKPMYYLRNFVYVLYQWKKWNQYPLCGRSCHPKSIFFFLICRFPTLNFFLSATLGQLHVDESTTNRGKGKQRHDACGDPLAFWSRQAPPPSPIFFLNFLQKSVFRNWFCDYWLGSQRVHQLKFGCFLFSGHRAVEKGREKMG